MVGWKKAGVIQQCRRCYALRTPENERECRSCRALLNISFNLTRPLAFCQPSSDASPVLTVNWRSLSEATISATGRLAWN
jgi:hypothetical protein